MSHFKEIAKPIIKHFEGKLTEFFDGNNKCFRIISFQINRHAEISFKVSLHLRREDQHKSLLLDKSFEVLHMDIKSDEDDNLLKMTCNLRIRKLEKFDNYFDEVKKES